MNPLCEFEDSQNCIWLHWVQGNKEQMGNSFIDIAGTTLYAEQLLFVAVMLFMVACIAYMIFDCTRNN